MKPLFIKKNGTVSKVSGIIMNLIPSYTLAEYNALTHKPLLWVRTDEDYAQIPSEDVSYGSGSVKDALDDLTNLSSHIWFIENKSIAENQSGTFTFTQLGVYAIIFGHINFGQPIGVIFVAAGYGYINYTALGITSGLTLSHSGSTLTVAVGANKSFRSTVYRIGETS